MMSIIITVCLCVLMCIYVYGSIFVKQCNNSDDEYSQAQNINAN